MDLPSIEDFNRQLLLDGQFIYHTDLPCTFHGSTTMTGTFATHHSIMAQASNDQSSSYYNVIQWPSYYQGPWHPLATSHIDLLPTADYQVGPQSPAENDRRASELSFGANTHPQRFPSSTPSIDLTEHDWFNAMTFDDFSSVCSLSSISDPDTSPPTASYVESGETIAVTQPAMQLESEIFPTHIQVNTETQRYHPQQRRKYVCSHPDCKSSTIFKRPCDFRKHLKRHIKRLPCRVAGCPQSWQPSFADAKDRERHEASHQPSIVCEWKGCDRVFSRRDNMRGYEPTLTVGNEHGMRSVAETGEAGTLFLFRQ
nr:hypothetical protein CFP56_70561 [Quercus suber]